MSCTETFSLVVFFLSIISTNAKALKKGGTQKLSMKSDVEVVSKLLDVNVFKHHNYEEMLWFMKYFSTKYSNISRLYSIGESVQNRKLWVFEISGNAGKHDPGEPEVKLIGGIHGEEAISKEVLLQFIKLMCEEYDKDSELTKLVETTRIHILPSLNPDGYAMARSKGLQHEGIGHTNAHGIDLNWNFPDQFFPTTTPSQPETEAIVEWIKSYPFVLSGSLHGGSLVVSYPYDDSPSGQNVYSATPDDDVFRHIARAYSVNHPTMHLANPKLNCTNRGQHFIDGVTNGAKWFSEPGGMQDYNYVKSNCFEVTIQIGCDKFPNASKIQSYWNENKKSLINFVNQVHTGVKGYVKDVKGKPLKAANIMVSDRQHPVTTADDGDYWRLLVPGSYEIQASIDGYKPQRKVVEVDQEKVTLLDFHLKPSQEDFEGEQSSGLFYNDPREGGQRQWSMAERRSREGDDVFPEDTAADFSKMTSNVHDERLSQGIKVNVAARHSATKNEERKDRTASVGEKKEMASHKGVKLQSTTLKPPLKTIPEQKGKEAALGTTVVCNVRGKSRSLKGVLKWKGYLPSLAKRKDNLIAGIELMKQDKLGTDGSFMGKRYFTAAPKQGYFVRYKDCQRVSLNTT